MPDDHSRSARLLAPAALLAFVLALVAIVGASGIAGVDDQKRARPAAGQQGTTEEDDLEPRKRRSRAVYTVKHGDTLGEISSKTGVDVETLEELNPDLDPVALTPGQKIKLRE